MYICMFILFMIIYYQTYVLYYLLYGLFKQVGRNSYKHNCLFLVLEAGGLSDVGLQQLILALRKL